MHEFSLCQRILQLVNQYTDHVAKNKITSIHLNIGELAAVDCESLTFWFPIVAKGSMAENATLKINIIPAEATCQYCDHCFQIHQRLSACPKCHNVNYHLLKGDALTIQSVEIL